MSVFMNWSIYLCSCSHRVTEVDASFYCIVLFYFHLLCEQHRWFENIPRWKCQTVEVLFCLVFFCLVCFQVNLMSAVSCTELFYSYIWAGRKRNGGWDVASPCFLLHPLITLNLILLQHVKPKNIPWNRKYVFVFLLWKFQQNSH